MADQPLLSIVITAYTTERLKDIYELLDSIEAQTYGHIETIFVAERSTELMDKVKSYTSKKMMDNVQVLFNSGEPGASAARNLGIIQAKGDIIAFIDDDAVAYPDWAEKMLAAYSDESIIGATGPAFPLWQAKPATWFPEEFYWILSCTSWTKWNKVTDVRNIWLQNGSFRRDVFNQAGMLNAALGPNDSTHGFKGREFKTGVVSEEVDLSIRARKATKKRIVYNPEIRVQHKVDPRRLKLGYVARWSYWMGCSKHKLKKLYPDDSDILSQERGLLTRIVTRLVPNMMIGVFSHPVHTGRKFLVTATALAGVSAGYIAAFTQQGKQSKAISK